VGQQWKYTGGSEQAPIRHSGEGRTKAQGALNAWRAARRVSEANHPGKSTNWTPAFAGVTTYSGVPVTNYSHLTSWLFTLLFFRVLPWPFLFSLFTSHVSRFTFHVSRFTFHFSLFTFHFSRITLHSC
jgi:hypothetical protein